MLADIDGQTVETNKKNVYTFVSATKAYRSASLNWRPGATSRWIQTEEYDVAIDGNKVTLTTHRDEHTTVVLEFTFTDITSNEFMAKLMPP